MTKGSDDRCLNSKKIINQTKTCQYNYVLHCALEYMFSYCPRGRGSSSAFMSSSKLHTVRWREEVCGPGLPSFPLSSSSPVCQVGLYTGVDTSAQAHLSSSNKQLWVLLGQKWTGGHWTGNCGFRFGNMMLENRRWSQGSHILALCMPPCGKGAGQRTGFPSVECQGRCPLVLSRPKALSAVT